MHIIFTIFIFGYFALFFILFILIYFFNLALKVIKDFIHIYSPLVDLCLPHFQTILKRFFVLNYQVIACFATFVEILSLL